MERIFKANFNWLNITGLIISVSLILFLLSSILNNFFPEQRQEGIKKEDLNNLFKERYAYDDSVRTVFFKQFLDTISIYSIRKRETDSILKSFYNSKTYDEKINSVNNSSNGELLRQWTNRYR